MKGSPVLHWIYFQKLHLNTVILHPIQAPGSDLLRLNKIMYDDTCSLTLCSIACSALNQNSDQRTPTSTYLGHMFHIRDERNFPIWLCKLLNHIVQLLQLMSEECIEVRLDLTVNLLPIYVTSVEYSDTSGTNAYGVSHLWYKCL